MQKGSRQYKSIEGLANELPARTFFSSKFRLNQEGANIFLELYPRFVFVIYKQGFFSCFRTVITDITATANVDYLPLDGVQPISPFVGVETITVPYLIFDDDELEGDETLVYAFSLFDDRSASGNPIADPAIITFVIVDDDAPRKYSNEEKYFQYNS